ncbi:hypothetical protein [Paenibacillus sp. TY11]
MFDFWNSLISSVSLVNSATILSLLIGILIFIYQEYKRRREQEKEVIRLKEEIVSLVIRNHVNSGVPVSSIDLNSIIEGYELLKNSKLRLDVRGISMMVYARIYENEHITDSIRLKFLKEVEEIINSCGFEYISSTEKNNSEENNLISSRLSLMISLLLVVTAIGIISKLYEKYQVNELLLYILIFISVILIMFSNSFMNTIVNRMLAGNFKFFDRKSRSMKKQENLMRRIETMPNILNNNLMTKEVKFEEVFNDKEKILEVVEQRVLLEGLLRQIYFEVFQEDNKKPLHYLVSELNKKGILPNHVTYPLKKAYSISSYVAHEATIPEEVVDYQSFISSLKETVAELYKIWTYIKDENSKNLN